MNRLIHFATVREAEVTLERVGIRDAKVGNAYPTDIGLIVISGMGLLATSYHLMKHIDDVNELISLGVAGTLTDRIPLHTVVSVGSIQRSSVLPCELDALSLQIMRNIHPTLTLASGTHSLCTSDYPVHHREIRSHLGQHSDLVDMEGYAVAYVAQAASKRCTIWKAVSDFASDGGRDTLFANLRRGSELLCELL